MKYAVVVHQYGGPEVLKFEEYPDPVPDPGDLVRVAATSVNPFDYKRRAGLMKDSYPIRFPRLIGTDISGAVIKIGPGVEGFSVGDQVFAMADNTYAELCVVKATVLAKVPTGLNLIQAAALPLVKLGDQSRGLSVPRNRMGACHFCGGIGEDRVRIDDASQR